MRQKTLPTKPLHHQQHQAGLLTQDMLDRWIHAADAKFWHHHLHVLTETWNIRPGYISSVLCRPVSRCPLQPQIPADGWQESKPDMVFWCCISFASRCSDHFNMYTELPLTMFFSWWFQTEKADCQAVKLRLYHQKLTYVISGRCSDRGEVNVDALKGFGWMNFIWAIWFRIWSMDEIIIKPQSVF